MKVIAERLLAARLKYLRAELRMLEAKREFNTECANLAEEMLDIAPCIVVGKTAIILDPDYSLGDLEAKDALSFYSVWQEGNEVDDEIRS